MIRMGMGIDDGIEPLDSECAQQIENPFAIVIFSAVNQNRGIGAVKKRRITLTDIEHIEKKLGFAAFRQRLFCEGNSDAACREGNERDNQREPVFLPPCFELDRDDLAADFSVAFGRAHRVLPPPFAAFCKR